MNILKKIQQYCKRYDIAIKYLLEVISDLKVIPMIRGKSFEFSVSDLLKSKLSRDWRVKNLNINAQQGTHDVDVQITRILDKKKIRVECKLTKNDSFQINQDNAEIRVKCMRSRTFSDNPAATRMATHYGVDRAQLLIHADSYREQDFDFVITSLGNSMWTTLNNKYTFNGDIKQFNLLKKLFPDDFKDFKKFQQEAFNFLMFAKSSDLVASTNNNLKCTRKKCRDKGADTNCGFIPNYPIINLNDVATTNSPWKRISCIESEFNNFLD